MPLKLWGVSAGRLRWTRALARFVVHEEYLVYDPTHPRLAMVAMRGDLRGVLEYLEEAKNEVRENLNS